MIELTKVLEGLPTALREPLLKTFGEIAANYVERRWEPSELNGGKFCEVVYSVVQGAVTGSFPNALQKPSNMLRACRALEELPANPQLAGDRSLRVLIPRLLPVLYDIRNNRGVGHIGGDVDPNQLDATAVYSMASWVLSELIRVFHNVTPYQAQDVVAVLAERKVPLIWEIDGKKRVLDSNMTNTDQVLLLLHQHSGWVRERDLLDWVEYSNPSVFRKSILKKLHRARFIEYDEANSRAKISPSGTGEVEQRIIKSRALMIAA